MVCVLTLYIIVFSRDAVKIFVIKSGNVINMIFELIYNTEPNSFYLMQNGGGEFFQALNISTFLYQNIASNYISTMFAVEIALTVFSTVIIFVMVVFIVKPAVWLIEGMLFALVFTLLS